MFPYIANQLLRNGRRADPRGEPTLEIEDFMFEVDRYHPYMTYKCRNYSVDYLKAEFRWYLNADPYDDSIEKHAKMWARIKQKDGYYFSNYGVYWFGDPQYGFKWVTEQLKRDPQSRRAVIPMLNAGHLFPENNDVVCTECISFRIRDDRLNMSVNMRSSDFILGYSYDLPAFCWLWKMVACELGIPIGRYMHKSDSLHVYERHWGMLEEIAAGKGHYYINVPDIDNVSDLLHGPYTSLFAQWLKGGSDDR